MQNIESTTCREGLHRFVVTCAPGLAKYLAEELQELSLKVTLEGTAAVTFQGDLENALQVCLYARLAERVFCPLTRVDAPPAEAARALAAAFNWQDNLARANAVHVTVNSGRGVKLNELAIARDFIAAAPYQLTLSRHAKRALTLHLHVTESAAELSVDLSGDSLQRRGYRLAGGKAPLRETLASALLRIAGWQGDSSLLDPFCGSGTILIEAALQAKRIAPGQLRDFHGFMQWSGCPDTLWEDLCKTARAQECPLPKGVSLKGFDVDADTLKLARANAERAGVAADIHFERRDLGSLKARDFVAVGKLVTNLPWGDRLETAERAAWLHAALGHRLRHLAPDWSATLLGANVEVMDRCGMVLEHQATLRNGADKNWIRHYHSQLPQPQSLLFPGPSDKATEDAARPMYNRLLKNGRKLKSWLGHNTTDVYRLYDRDLPEFNVTVDVYGDKVLVREQKAPSKIPDATVRKRRQLALNAIRTALSCYPEQISLRTRTRQKGHRQYHKLGDRGRFHVVHEGRAQLLVNLEDYQDSGLFLDHRPLRLMLADKVAGKRFLNLFAYTGSATVHAALGGAKASVSVDSSKRYIDWAANNLAVNGFSTQRHQLVTDDVRHWLDQNHDQFDIIFCDPPTFSNSKSRDDFVVQRDHAALIERIMKKVTDTGVLYFSCNLGNFHLDASVQRHWQVADITRQTLDPDCQRHPDIHHCFEIRRHA